MIEKNIISETATNNAAFAKRTKLQKWSNIFEGEKEIH